MCTIGEGGKGRLGRALFATTALVATAGVASADIALSGVAQMGIQGGSGNATTQFVQDIDVTFTMSGTADNGLTFGAAIDLDESAAGVGTNDAGVAIFISGDFGTLTLGDTDGALDWAMTEVNVAGASINDNETAHAGFSGNAYLDGHYDGQILRYDYSFGDFAVALSVEQDDNTTGLGAAPNAAGNRIGFGNYIVGTAAVGNVAAVTADPIWAIGGRYSGAFAGGTFGVGVGYQWTTDAFDNGAAGLVDVAVTGLSANVALDSGFSAAVNYAMINVDITGVTATDGTHWGIGAAYTFDAITIAANYGQYDWESNAAAGDSNGYGLVAQYDFGGGLSAHLGYGWSDVTAVNQGVVIGGVTGPAATLGNSSNWSFGLNMAF
jgi:outer membrane protein OmpU